MATTASATVSAIKANTTGRPRAPADDGSQQHNNRDRHGDPDMRDDSGQDAQVRDHQRQNEDRDRDGTDIAATKGAMVSVTASEPDGDLESRAQRAQPGENEIVPVAPEERALAPVREAITGRLQKVQPPQAEDEHERRDTDKHQRAEMVAGADHVALTPAARTAMVSPSRMIANRP